MTLLEQQINEDIKQAMREKNELKLSVLRMLNSAIKNKTISMRTTADVELTDEQLVDIIASEAKKRQDSVETYLAGNRSDLADKEKKEIEILLVYLPAQLDDEEVKLAVEEIIANNEGLDFGKLMGLAMAQLKGKADGKRVGEMVKRVMGK